MENRTRYTMSEAKRNKYFQLPKFLFEAEFAGLSNDARILYSLLRGRHDLSLKNNWVNGRGEIYLIYTREDMGEMLNLSKPTVIKAVNELKNNRLIEEERTGLGKANRIYLLGVDYDGDIPEKSKIFTSGSQESFTHEVNNIAPSKNDISNNIKYHIPSDQEDYKDDESGKCQKKERFSDSHARDSVNESEKHPNPNGYYTGLLEIIKSNISYDTIKNNGTVPQDALDEICGVITSTISGDFKDGYISMGGEKVNAETVKSAFRELNRHDIEYFYDCYSRQKEPITKITSYIRAALYRNRKNNAIHPPGNKDRMNLELARAKPYRNRFNNFEGRKIDYAELERLEREYAQGYYIGG